MASPEALVWAWSQDGITSNEKFLLVAMAGYATTDNGNKCWVSAKKLASRCSMGERTVRRLLSQLVEKGLIEDTGQRYDYHNRVIVWGLNLETGQIDRIHETCQTGRETCQIGRETGQTGRETGQIGRTLNSINSNNSSKSIYTDDFETFWQAKPKRAGGDSKAKAFKAWAARLQEGKSPESMVQLAQRYHRYCEAEGKLGTQYVKQGATLLSKDQDFDEQFELPKKTAGSKLGRIVDAFESKNRTREPAHSVLSTGTAPSPERRLIA